MFNLKYIDLKRLNKYISIYFPKDISQGKRLAIMADFIWSVIRDGAGINDYFEYEFYKKRHNERKKFVVRTKRRLIAKRFNDPKKAVLFLLPWKREKNTPSTVRNGFGNHLLYKSS